MTQDTQDPSMQKPTIEGQGGVDEATEEVATNPKEEETSDQQITTDQEEMQSQLDKLEKERKQLARTNARQGERAKEAKLAALDAVAQLDKEKATMFLEQHPEFKDEFDEMYPEFFEEDTEEPAPKVEPKKEEATDKDLLKAELLADLAKASKDSEQEEISLRFAVDNQLNKEEQRRLKKVANAIVSADSSTSFQEAISIAYQNKYGKLPNETVNITTSSGAKPKGYTKEQLDWWSKSVDSNIVGDKAIEVQKGADEFYNSLQKGAPK